MTHLPPSVAAARLRLAGHQVAELADVVTAAYAHLERNQATIPSPGDGGRSPGSHSDPTGTMATGHPDPIRAAFDELDRLVRRITADATDALRIARQSRDPSGPWVNALATEAAAKLSAEDRGGCRCCAQDGNHWEPVRAEGGTLCDWCDRWVRDIAGTTTTAWMLPVWFVHRHHQGQRITSRERAKAEADWRGYSARRKGRRSA